MAERNDPFLPEQTVPGTDSLDPIQVAQLDPARIPTAAQPAPAQPSNPYAFKPPADLTLYEPPPLSVPQTGRPRRAPVDAPPPIVSADEAAAKMARFKQSIGFEEDPGAAVSLSKAFSEGFASGLSKPLQYSGNTLSQLDGTKPEDSDLVGAGKWIDKKVDDFFPPVPQFRSDTFLYKVVNGVGQFGGMVAFAAGAGVAVSGTVGTGGTGGAVVGGAARLLPWIFRTTAAGRVGLTAGAKVATVAGVGTGVAVGTAGMEGFDDAIRHGASLDDAYLSMHLNGATGLLDPIPVFKAIRAADKVGGGQVMRTIRNITKSDALVAGLRAGSQEAIQEAVQQVAQNLIASDVVKYDPDRQMFEGSGDAAGVGFTVGALYGAIFAMLPGRGRPTMRGTPQPNPPDQAPPGTPQLPPPRPDAPTSDAPEIGGLPGPGGGRGSYFDLPPPPDNATFLKGQIDRLTKLDDLAKANDPRYTGDADIGETIQFFRYLEKSEADFERLRSMDPVSRQMPQNEILAQEVAANRELIELMKDPIRMVSRPTYALQMPSKGRTPGQVIQIDTDESGQPIYKKNGKWVRAVGGKDIAVGAGKVIRIDDTRPENLAMSPVGQKMIREARERMAADRARLQVELDAQQAEQRKDPRSARSPEQTMRQLERPVQDRPDSAPGPMQTVEQAAMAAAGERQTKQKQAAQDNTRATLEAASEAVRGDPGRYVLKDELPGEMRQRLEARAIQLGRPVPDVLQKQDLLDAGLPENDVQAMFARRADARRISELQAASEAAARRRSDMRERPLRGTGITAFLDLLPKGDVRRRRAVGNMLRHFRKLLGPQFDMVKVLDLTAWLRRDPDALKNLRGNGTESAVFLGKYNVRLADRINHTQVAFRSDRPAVYLKDVTHELTHALVYMRGMSSEELGSLWSQVSEDAKLGRLDENSRQIFNEIARDYRDQPTHVKGEEFLAFSVENFLRGRYETREDLKATDGQPYTWADRIHDFVVGLYRMVRDTFEGVLGRHALTSFLRNIENTYGVSVLEPPPPVAEKPTPEQMEARFSRRVEGQHNPFYSSLYAQFDAAIQAKSMPMSATGRDYRGLLENWTKQGVVNREELNWTMIDGEVGIMDWLARPENAGQRFSAMTIRDMIGSNAVSIYATPPLAEDGGEAPFDWPSRHDGTMQEPDSDYVSELADQFIDEELDALYANDDSAVTNVLLTGTGEMSNVLSDEQAALLFPQIHDTEWSPADFEGQKGHKQLRDELSRFVQIVDAREQLRKLYDAQSKKISESGLADMQSVVIDGETITPTKELVDTLDELAKRKIGDVAFWDRATADQSVVRADLYDSEAAFEAAIRQISQQTPTILKEPTALDALVAVAERDERSLERWMDAVEDRARDRANDLAYESAEADAEYVWDDYGDTGWSIIGNTEVGYAVRDENGVTVGRANNFNEAQIVARDVWSRTRSSGNAEGRGTRWSDYQGVFEGRIQDYSETLLIWNNDSVEYTKTSHWDGQDKNVVAFMRHGQLDVTIGGVRTPTEFMVEGQSDWSKETVFSAAAKRRMDKIDEQVAALYEGTTQEITALLQSSPALASTVQSFRDFELSSADIQAIARYPEPGRRSAAEEAFPQPQVSFGQLLNLLDEAPVLFISRFGIDGYNDARKLKVVADAAMDVRAKLLAERAAVEPYSERSSGTVPPAPFVGSPFEKVAQSWVTLLAKYHVWRTVAEGKRIMSWTRGAESASLWGVEPLSNVSVEYVDAAVLPDQERAQAEAEARGNNPSNPPGKSKNIPRTADGKLPRFIVSGWNGKDKIITGRNIQYAATVDDLRKMLGADIYAAVEKRGFKNDSSVVLRMGIDVPQSYFTFTQNREGSPKSGYRVVYDKMYADAVRDIFKKMGWSKGEDPVYSALPINTGLKVWAATIPEEGAAFIEQRGVPTFGTKPAPKALPAGADPNLQADPEALPRDGIQARFARRAPEVQMPVADEKLFRPDTDPKPEANIARGREAMRAVIEAASRMPEGVARVTQAMYRYGVGWIGFFAGTRAHGLDHVMRLPERRELSTRIPEIIAKGQIGPYYIRPSRKEGFERLRRNIVLNGETVVTAPIFDEQRTPWLVTARPKTENRDDAFFDRSAGGIPVADADAESMIAAALANDMDAYQKLGARIRAEAGNIPLVSDMSGVEARFARRTDIASDGTYSALMRAISDSPRKRAPAGVWQAWVKEAQKGGVTEAELKWSGLREWLRDRKGEIKREDVLDFLRKSEVRVSETVLGETKLNEAYADELEARRVKDVERAHAEYEQLAGRLARSRNVDEATMLEAARQYLDVLAPESDGDPSEYRAKLMDMIGGQSRMNYDAVGNLDYKAQSILVAEQKLEELRQQVEEVSQGVVTKDNRFLTDDNTARWGREQYQGEILETPGERRDYREIVFRWTPNIDAGVVVDKNRSGKWSVYGAGLSMHGFPTEDEARYFATNAIGRINYKHLHWDGIANPLFHARFNMRTDADGKNVLYIEELQSDWHNAARSASGYREQMEDAMELQDESTAAMQARESLIAQLADKFGKTANAGMAPTVSYDMAERWLQIDGRNADLRKQLSDAMATPELAAAADRDTQLRYAMMKLADEANIQKDFDEATRKLADVRKRVERANAAPPQAPYDGGDPEVVGYMMKRLVRWAIDQGAQRVAWTPGVVQAARYGLDSYVSRLDLRAGTEPGTYDVTAYDMSGAVMDLSRLDSQYGIDPASMNVHHVRQVFGDPVANTVMAAKVPSDGSTVTLSGKELGGEDKAKRDLYDTILPNAAKSILRSFGLPQKLATSRIETTAEMRGRKGWDGSAINAPAIDITPEMIEAADDIGFARFARRGAAAPPPPPSPGPNWFQRMADYIGRHDPIFTQTSQRIRAVGGTRASYELGNEFRRDIHQRVGPGVKGMIGEDYHSTIQGLHGRFLPRLSDLLDALPESALRVLPDVLRGTYLNPQTGRVTIPPSSGLTAQQAQAFRAFLNDALDFANAHMQGTGPNGPGKGSGYVTAQDLIGKIANYYPQQWMLDGAFTEGPLSGIDRTAAAMQFFKAAGIYANSSNQDASLREMLNNIQGLYGFVSYASSSIGPIGRTYFLADSTLKRVLTIDPTKTFQIVVGGKTVDVRLSDFLHNDPAHTLVNYVQGLMRHAEWVRRFGPKGQVIDDYMKRIDAERAAAGQPPLTPDEQNIIVHAIQSNVGGLKRPNKTFDNFQQWVQVGGNAIYLSLSTLSSLPELVMPAVRTGVTGQLYAYRAGLKSLFTMSGVSKDRQFARELGILHDEVHNALQNSVADYGNLNIQKWNRRIFQAIGLNLFTRWTLTMSTAAARFSLPGWARLAAQGSAKHQRWLGEVGLTAADLANYDASTYVPGSNAKIDAALRQMAGEMVINPTHAGKAAWMNDPRFRLVAHIKSYMWGFNNTILQRMGRETINGNLLPLIFLIGTAALAGLLADLREWIMWGEEGNPALNKLRDSGDPTLVWMYNAADRGGLLSHLQLPVNMLTQTRAGSSGTWTGTLVPAVGMMDNALKVTRGTFGYIATGDEAELRMAVDGASRFVPGLVWTGTSLLADTNRSEFVDMVAPKKQRSGGQTNSNPRGVSGTR